jgi:hypothetical protein
MLEKRKMAFADLINTIDGQSDLATGRF